MSIVSVAYLKDGIVMSSDCRGSFTKIVDGVKVTKTIDRAPKTFLIENINVGISYCGNMRLHGELFHTAINRFFKEHLDENDNVCTVAKKIFNEYKKNETIFIVCGYFENEQLVYCIENDLKCINKTGANHYHGVKPFGMTESVTRIVYPHYSQTNWTEISLEKGVNITEEMVTCAIENEASCGKPISTLIIDSSSAYWIRKNGQTQTIKL